MRKCRNPRYAPEFLERKLSPSAMTYGIAVTAVYTSAFGNDPSPTPTTSDSTSGPWMPPTVPLAPLPIGPAGPA